MSACPTTPGRGLVPLFRSARSAVAFSVACGLLTSASSAQAESSTATTAVTAAELAGVTRLSAKTSTGAGSGMRTEKRAVPNLDRRPEEGADAGDVLLWVPRALLSPLHLVFEWGLRRPIGSLLTVAERDKWADVIVDFLTFEDRKIGVIPTVFYDFNFRPSVGLYVFWNELGHPAHSMRLVGGFGGLDWYRATLADRWDLGGGSQLDFSINYWGRPDYIYAGEGAGAENDPCGGACPDNRSRYFEEYYEGKGSLLVNAWRGSEIRLELGVRHSRFDNGAAESDERSIEAAVAGADPYFDALPTGYSTGLFSNYQRLLLRLDTRQARPEPGSGFLLELQGSHGWDMERPGERQWVGYGAEAGAFWDLGQWRVLGLSAMVQLADPLKGKSIPFTELVVLGRKPGEMEAFLPGTLRGRSAAIATLEYRYPIWIFLDGTFHASVGNVFDERFEGFQVQKMRSSFGLGVRSTQDPDNELTILFALGTSRFDEPFSVDSFRLVAGTQTGF